MEDATGVQVALHYHSIGNNVPEWDTCMAQQTKAIHIEVDSLTLQHHWEQIGLLFSAKTKEFPAGIKLRLVAKIPNLTDDKAHQKVKEWQVLQTCFLAISDTRSLWVTPHPDYNNIIK